MRFKKVLLICPSFQNIVGTMPYRPNAGIGYVAQSLYDNKIDYNAIDMRLGYDISDVLDNIRHYKPDLIGISMLTLDYLKTYKMIFKIKSTFKNIKILIGGSHACMFREQVLQDCKEIDFSCLLIGEEVIVDLCKGLPLNKIKGLVFRDNNSIKSNEMPIVKNLDNYPFPKFHNFEMDRYTTKEISIITSRGCPYECIFCTIMLVWGKKFCYRSASNILKEIKYWYDKGYRNFNILDDNFTLIRKRVVEFCNMIIKENLKVHIKIDNGTRADKVDYELLKLMKKAGFEYLAVGVEVGNDKMLKVIKKEESMQQIDDAVRMACELGFNVNLFFIIGFPYETEKDVHDSFKFALKYPINSVSFYNPIPFPNTELYNFVKENNYLLYPYQQYLNEIYVATNKPLFYTPELSVKKRIALLKKGKKISNKVRKNYYKFYFKDKPIHNFFVNIFYSDIGHHILEFMDENKFIYRYKKRITDKFFTK